MAADFPNNPNNGDTFTSNVIHFIWDGTTWKRSSTPGVKGQKGEFIKGQKGDPGQKGQKGEDNSTKGQKGTAGEDNSTKGEPGSKGQKGDTGDKGQKGEQNDKGQKGEEGESGMGHSNKTSSYNLVASDDQKLITTNSTITVPQNVFSTGEVVTIYAHTSNSISINQGSGTTLRLGGTGTTGNRTLNGRGLATIVCFGSNQFVVSGAGLS